MTTIDVRVSPGHKRSGGHRVTVLTVPDRPVSVIESPHPEPAAPRDSLSAVDEWGPAPTAEESAQAEQLNLWLQTAQRQQALEGALSRRDVAGLIGVSPQAVSEMAADGRLVGIKHGREWRFPMWQFTPDAVEPILPALRQLTEAFPGGVVSLIRWATTPATEFDGQTPATVMRIDPERVIATARALTAAGW